MAKTEEATGPDLMGAIVVLDTNILDQTSLLRDPLSVSLLAYLIRLDASLGLPEVVRGEWAEHWVAHCQKRYSAFQDHRRWLAGHFAGVPEFNLDVAEAARERLELRLADLRHVLIEESIQPNDWRQAGEMVIRKVPPTTPASQQFKDSLMWRALLRMGQGQLCVLVTADKGFTVKGATDLAPSLAEEASARGAEIVVFPTLRDILEAMKAQVGPIEESIEGEWEAILEEVVEDVSDALLGEGWLMVGSPESSYSVFATDVPGVLALAIELECQIAPADDPDANLSTYVEARCSALYDLQSEKLDVDIEQLDTIVMTPHGDISTRVVDRRPQARELTLRFG